MLKYVHLLNDALFRVICIVGKVTLCACVYAGERDASWLLATQHNFALATFV